MLPTTYEAFQIEDDLMALFALNSVDPYLMLKNVASHQGVYCLPPIQQVLDMSAGSKMDGKLLDE